MPTNANTISFEAKLDHANLLKKVIEAIKDLLGDCTWDCTNQGMSLQSMDSSHVALVNVVLKEEGFEFFKCERNLNMGISLASMAKVLKCAGADDSVTIRTDGDSNMVSFIFQSQEGVCLPQSCCSWIQSDYTNLVLLGSFCGVWAETDEYRRGASGNPGKISTLLKNTCNSGSASDVG